MAELDALKPYLAKIRTIDTFRYLGDKELQRLLRISEIAIYEPGDRIIAQGDISEHFYAVIEGSVEVSVQELNKEDVVIGTINSGDVFGESAVFLKEPRTASVTSKESTTVVRFHRKDMMAYIKANPQAGIKILTVIILGLLGKLKSANQEIAFEKQSDIDFDYVGELVDDFMSDL